MEFILAARILDFVTQSDKSFGCFASRRNLNDFNEFISCALGFCLFTFSLSLSVLFIWRFLSSSQFFGAKDEDSYHRFDRITNSVVFRLFHIKNTPPTKLLSCVYAHEHFFSFIRRFFLLLVKLCGFLWLI